MLEKNLLGHLEPMMLENDIIFSKDLNLRNIIINGGHCVPIHPNRCDEMCHRAG